MKRFHRHLGTLLAGLVVGMGVQAAPSPKPSAQAPPVDPEVKRIQSAYQTARPADRDLGIFRLDWAASLKDAKARAAKEKRPIFFVSTMQLKDAGDLRGGHC